MALGPPEPGRQLVGGGLRRGVGPGGIRLTAAGPARRRHLLEREEVPAAHGRVQDDEAVAAARARSGDIPASTAEIVRSLNRARDDSSGPPNSVAMYTLPSVPVSKG